ncbi:nucleotide sugar dehydrogenase [Bradyrhizobium sp. BWC-3-1]|uniref:nucleotide sugar dehydrogenase n=1 Tax=Bradyrhizobium sp. BWC-3-1 TaxID=3080012 RepID=UPI00293F616C|nr:nucleotide sugar dehydrogenase [Bradyrhizobium sp. BWC-3-1]WOH56998.1 nucleotide sugar dehydrogenase [Bradyrhizobium sp. BWC-3-1]
MVGLGKLGLPLAALLATRGFEVVGLDADRRRIDGINAGLVGGSELGLESLIRDAESRLRLEMISDQAIAISDVTFIIVPTPSGPDGRFRNDSVIAAIRQIGNALRATDRYHLVVLVSTVMPTSMTEVIAPALEKAARRKVGDRLGLCYSPEFVALGSVIRDMSRPDLLLIGESDAAAGDLLLGIYRAIIETKPEIHRMNFVNAEICKLAVNSFVTTKISFANMIAEACDHLPSADAEVVLRAAGADSRIGHDYLRGAVGYGGPCFPRDNIAFTLMGRDLGLQFELAAATDATNRHQLQRLCAVIEARAQTGATIAILGMSYKPGTDVIEASQGIALAQAMFDGGFNVLIADPAAAQNAAAILGHGVSVASAAEAVARADVVAIMTQWPQFRNIPMANFMRDKQNITVIDPWRVFKFGELPSSVEHIVLGFGPDAAGEPPPQAYND